MIESQLIWTAVLNRSRQMALDFRSRTINIRARCGDDRAMTGLCAHSIPFRFA